MAVLRRACVTVALLAAWPLPGSGQGQPVATGPIRGRVVAEDGSPVDGAVVRLVGRPAFVRTEAAGEFQFLRVPAGPATLQISAIGYAQKHQDIRVGQDSGWAGTIALERIAQSLPEVDVTAPASGKYDDFFRRQRLGLGTFRTREDFERMGATDVVSALQGIPGVTVSATSSPFGEPEVRFRLARCPGNPPNLGIYVNGTRVALFGAQNRGSELSALFRLSPPRCAECVRIGEVLSSLVLLDVMFLEFYRGSGQIPGDLDRGDNCAALVVWTRKGRGRTRLRATC